MKLITSILCAGLLGLGACGSSQSADETTPASAAAETTPAQPEAPAADAPGTPIAVAASELSWQDVPDGGGLQMAVVYQDPSTNGMAFFVKAPAGWSHPNHYHPTDFHRLVVEGDMLVTLTDGSTVAAKAGDYLRGRANTVHSSSTENGVTLFIVSDGAFASILVDDSGKPLQADAPAPGEPTGDAVVVAADARPWQDVPGRGGVQAAPVFRDPSTGATALFIRAAGGFQTPLHKHTSDFHRVMLEGSLTITPKGGDAVTSNPGDYARGIKGVPHVGSGDSGGLLFVVSDGPWEQVPVTE